MDIKKEYPYYQYFKDGKVDLPKIIADGNMITDHIMVRLLLCVIQEQQEKINSLSGYTAANNLIEIKAIPLALSPEDIKAMDRMGEIKVMPKLKTPTAKPASKPGRKKK